MANINAQSTIPEEHRTPPGSVYEIRPRPISPAQPSKSSSKR